MCSKRPTSPDGICSFLPADTAATPADREEDPADEDEEDEEGDEGDGDDDYPGLWPDVVQPVSWV